ncbi:1-acyl-sn-glycerol-3-phosphate acyltransferase [bacterium]|nr:1-acyl-sn-glycerol-3-phosphate acyltransferase [bacterium]
MIVSNHQSLFDPPVIGSFLSRLRISPFAKKELFQIPILKTVITLLGAIPVNRYGNDIDGLKKAISVLNNNGALMMFPEGTRTLDGNVHPFKNGPAFLIRKTKCNILPVYIDGFFNMFPKNGKKRLRYPVKMIVGRIYTYSEIKNIMKNIKDRRLLSEYLYNMVTRLKTEVGND